MQKIIAFCLSCTLLSPVLAAQPSVHSLTPSAIQSDSFVSHTKSQRNNIMTNFSAVKAGGFGGNARIGRLIYSGTQGNLPALNISRSSDGTCYFLNSNVNIVLVGRRTQNTISFPCSATDPMHGGLYWNADFGAVNGGYSPENDTMYAIDVITNMFNAWYGIPPKVDQKGLQAPIIIRLHDKVDDVGLMYNADYDLFVGDGVSAYYPLTSLNVFGYLTGSLFTKQHSALNWDNSQSEGINIAFSCMTAMAAEFYATGKNTWQISGEISKTGTPLHYMDTPSKNCNGKQPGDYCDIDTLSQYHDDMMGYFSSGLFNRAFYLLATTNGWNTHKAYDVFLQANRYHWKSDTDFHSGACAAVVSAIGLGYDAAAVVNAFSGVGIDTRNC